MKNTQEREGIFLEPVEMTRAVMVDLEERGLIIRLAPGSHQIGAKEGETVCKTIYHTDPSYGSHKLMYIEVNRTALPEFGTHPENEDFYLLGLPGNKPLYLVIALCLKDVLDDKIKSQTLTSADFITLKVKYNDPEVSFFTMLKDVPHGEAVGTGEGGPGTFYVTESTDLIDVDSDMGTYELVIKE